ncbi:unnamed protein product [Triticum turgidum subsp. durum]|uniref:Flavin-containing monooxygenase n=1 Tax=Triticum turgidum subsp. durum TaxID=4567 RepID=A0A9R0Z3L7_TRITD|nr:unnamed protein product [Triticum turgidum subsp. durum]
MENSAPPVIIVGAGPSGLAASACLARRGVDSIVLERDDCVGSLWQKRAYDRLHLHLPKQASALPHLQHADDAPAYLPRDHFVRYLDAYADRFAVRARLRLRREVRSARFIVDEGRWEVDAVHLGTGDTEQYVARYLVVATGEFDEKVFPVVPGLDTFPGEAIHASEYRSAEGMRGKEVLVVSCGNSGMEIALDLAQAGAAASIVVRGELHLMTREIMNASTALFAYLPVWMIDRLAVFACRVVFGDTARHGLRRPDVGPFTRKIQSNVYPVIDVGTYDKIKSGQIQVLPVMTNIEGDVVEFSGGERRRFDAIVLATGYRSMAKKWLKVRSITHAKNQSTHICIIFVLPTSQLANASSRNGTEAESSECCLVWFQSDDGGLIGDDGMASGRSPKGGNGLYHAGLAGRGIYGSGTGGEFIAEDISRLLRQGSGDDDGDGV